MLACLPGWEGGGSSSRAPLHACTPESEVLPRNPRERKEGRKEGGTEQQLHGKNPKIREKEVKSAASSCKKKIMEERIVKEENFLK